MVILKIIRLIKRSKLIEISFRVVFFIVSMLPTQKKTIVFESFLGKQYSDNPKALYKYIKENYTDYNLYWSVDRRFRSNFREENLRCLTRLSLRWIYHMATAKYWIVNSRLPLWVPKPRHTIYVQTWHGTPLKKLGIDIETVHMPNVTTESYRKDFLYEASKWDYLVSPNHYATGIFERAFGFNKTIIESGYPRNDTLIRRNNWKDINQLKKKLGIPDNKNVILYAPTWRDNDYYETGSYKFDLELDLNQLYKQFKEEYVILFRMHYLIAGKLNLDSWGNFIMDFSNYNDIDELYLVSDILITDYSSVFFDYANLRRPILFYVYDLEVYRDDLRGFYFNLEKDAPGPLVYDTKEIIQNINMITQGKYTLPLSFERFYKKYCYLEDGNAAKKVTNEIFSK